MKFSKEDENYIYQIIGKKIKKYKLRGWTQEQLAEKIDYSLSFISGIESAYHQTFSLGALWRISRVLGVDFYKLCEDENEDNSNTKYINYKCDLCGTETKMPIKVVKHFKNMYELTGNQNLPTFDCTNCDGQLRATNPMDF